MHPAVLVGVITEYDIVSKRGEMVGDIMSRGVVTVTDDTSAARVVELVGLHGIRGIPVLHDGALGRAHYPRRSCQALSLSSLAVFCVRA